MKRIHTISLLLLLSALLPVSCDKIDGARADEAPCELRIDVRLPGAERTRTNYTDLLDGELGVNGGYIFVFDATSSSESAQTLEVKQDISSMSFTASSLTKSASVTVTPGDKRVCVLMNVPSTVYSSIETYQDFLDIRYEMSDESVSGSKKYFQMAGTSDIVDVTADGTTVAVDCRRVAARVALRSITNSTGYPVTVNGIWLSNVAGDYCANARTTVNTWYNRQGRKDESGRNTSHVIDGSSYTASLPDFTYESLSATISSGGSYRSSSQDPVDLLYCFPNPKTSTPDGFTSSYSGEYTVLVLDVTIRDVRQYYPVVLSTVRSGCTYPIESNYAYTVDMTLSGYGSPDPNDPDDRVDMSASCQITVEIEDWITGASYTETI